MPDRQYGGVILEDKWGKTYLCSTSLLARVDLGEDYVTWVHDRVFGCYFLHDLEPHWNLRQIWADMYQHAKPWAFDLSKFTDFQLRDALLDIFAADEMRIWQLSEGWGAPPEGNGIGEGGLAPEASSPPPAPASKKTLKPGGGVANDAATPVQPSSHASLTAPCDVIVLPPGTKGCWNDQLNGELKPNATYQVGEYTYKTDEMGRVVTVSGTLDLTKQDRNTYQQTKAGKTAGIKDGLEDDEGGHLIASIFNGPGEQINYAAMDGNLNKGAWKKMENDWTKAIKGPPPKNVDVKINAIYEGDSKRAEAFEVEYFVDGEMFEAFFENNAGG